MFKSNMPIKVNIGQHSIIAEEQILYCYHKEF